MSSRDLSTGPSSALPGVLAERWIRSGVSKTMASQHRQGFNAPHHNPSPRPFFLKTLREIFVLRSEVYFIDSDKVIELSNRVLSGWVTSLWHSHHKTGQGKALKGGVSVVEAASWPSHR